ncbi:MAG: hypothetical protein H0Z32_08795 [Bacillaceae bacterium]|nr:hypothetical protein [Bacillaceae bacterium]
MKFFKLSFILFLAFGLVIGCTSKDDEANEASKDSTKTEDNEKKEKTDSKIENPIHVTVSTFAGTGLPGAKDGSKMTSNYSFPYGITEGDDGTLYISELRGNRIRLIDSEGTVSTFAGDPSLTDEYGKSTGGLRDGAGNQAMFYEPKGIAADSEGNLYIADSQNGVIRKISADGTVSTIASGLNHPADLIVKDNGNLIVSETLNHRIIELSNEGEQSIIAGGGYKQDEQGNVGGLKDGQGKQAQFNEPSAIALGTDGTLYVCDTGNQRIRAIDPQGNVTTIAGTGSEQLPGSPYIQGGYIDGSLTEARFNFPKGIAVADDGTIFVADTYNHVIRAISLEEEQVITVAGNGDHGLQNGDAKNATFDGPHEILFTNGQLLVVDQWNHLIRTIRFEQ